MYSTLCQNPTTQGCFIWPAAYSVNNNLLIFFIVKDCSTAQMRTQHISRDHNRAAEDNNTTNNTKHISPAIPAVIITVIHALTCDKLLELSDRFAPKTASLAKCGPAQSGAIFV